MTTQFMRTTEDENVMSRKGTFETVECGICSRASLFPGHSMLLCVNSKAPRLLYFHSFPVFFSQTNPLFSASYS